MKKPTKTSGSVSDRTVRENLNLFMREMRKLITSKNEVTFEGGDDFSNFRCVTEKGIVIQLSLTQKEE